jgi:hypothetical protein
MVMIVKQYKILLDENIKNDKENFLMDIFDVDHHEYELIVHVLVQHILYSSI